MLPPDPRGRHVFLRSFVMSGSGTIFVIIISLISYYLGVPLWLLTLFVIIGTLIEFMMINKSKD